MSARNFIIGISAMLFISNSSALMQPVAAAENPAAGKLPMSMEEIASKRRSIREELMLPSLRGIKSISYRVVGYKDFQPLENLMASKLTELKLRQEALSQVKDKEKAFDAIVQISFLKSGNDSIAELKVIQWVSLLRDPSIKVRAVTYNNKTFFQGKPEQAVEQLSNEFLIDYLKANQKTEEKKATAKK